jgi:mannose-6-phosphate isomerase
LRRFDGGRSATGEGELPVPDGGARILLCTAGAASLHRGDTTVQIKRGSAVWLADDDRGVRVTPDADDTQLFLATDGL